MDENKWIDLEKKLQRRNLGQIYSKIKNDKVVDFVEFLIKCGYKDPAIEDFLTLIYKYKNDHSAEIPEEYKDIDQNIIDRFNDYMVNEIENYAIYDKKAIFLFGLPGSGKSTILETIQKEEKNEYILVDADDYKRGVFHNGKLVFEPLQDPNLSGIDVEIIHKTTSFLAKFFAEYLISIDANIALPKVGDYITSVKQNIESMLENDYKIRVIFVFTTVETALKRNRKRYLDSKSSHFPRIIPPLLISEMSYLPLYNFFEIEELFNSEKCTFEIWDAEGDKPVRVYQH